MTLFAVDKIRENHIKTGIEFYLKQLPKIQVIEIKVKDKEKESQDILKQIKPSDFVVLLDVQGEFMDSLEYSKYLEKLENEAKDIVFVIGGSYGVSDSVKQRANKLLSFSKMTFPHELFRLMFFEQLYRAYSLKNNKNYHK